MLMPDVIPPFNLTQLALVILISYSADKWITVFIWAITWQIKKSFKNVC